MLIAALTGFSTGFGLILAIGAQNAFVLRQGILRAHVIWVCLTCAISDAILIAAGVAGFGALATAAPWAPKVMLWGGAAFLIVYGALRFRAALSPEGMALSGRRPAPLRATILTTLAFTWLNPHVYLDTLALIGAISLEFQGDERTAFGVAAAGASFVFFFSLGYGARLLAPLFQTARAWRILDVAVGLTMWIIAAQLIL